jgi:hypothetical protein
MKLLQKLAITAVALATFTFTSPAQARWWFGFRGPRVVVVGAAAPYYGYYSPYYGYPAYYSYPAYSYYPYYYGAVGIGFGGHGYYRGGYGYRGGYRGAYSGGGHGGHR